MKGCWFRLMMLALLLLFVVGCNPTPPAPPQATTPAQAKPQTVAPTQPAQPPVTQPTQAPTTRPTQAPTTQPTQTPTTQPTPSPTAQPAQGGQGLTVVGLVRRPLNLSAYDLRQVGMVKISVENPQKVKTDYEGVRLSALLAQATLQDEAAKLVFVARDNSTAEVALAAVKACADCMVAFNAAGGLDMVMPGMEARVWMKNVARIEAR